MKGVTPAPPGNEDTGSPILNGAEDFPQQQVAPGLTTPERIGDARVIAIALDGEFEIGLVS